MADERTHGFSDDRIGLVLRDPQLGILTVNLDKQRVTVFYRGEAIDTLDLGKNTDRQWFEFLINHKHIPISINPPKPRG